MKNELLESAIKLCIEFTGLKNKKQEKNIEKKMYEYSKKNKIIDIVNVIRFTKTELYLNRIYSKFGFIDLKTQMKIANIWFDIISKKSTETNIDSEELKNTLALLHKEITN